VDNRTPGQQKDIEVAETTNRPTVRHDKLVAT
jgi:hypothetical protein